MSKPTLAQMQAIAAALESLNAAGVHPLDFAGYAYMIETSQEVGAGQALVDELEEDLQSNTADLGASVIRAAIKFANGH